MKISLSKNQDKENIKTAYTQALADLATIKTTSFANNTQRDLAIKKQAEILEKLLKFIKSQI